MRVAVKSCNETRFLLRLFLETKVHAVKTIEVKDCGYCPFRCGGEHEEDENCNLDPGPPPRHRGRWKGIECSYRRLPVDCPLRKEIVRVKAVRKPRVAKP